MLILKSPYRILVLQLEDEVVWAIEYERGLREFLLDLNMMDSSIQRHRAHHNY
jgi:hypothetical protein